jgi:hypothetical protein
MDDFALAGTGVQEAASLSSPVFELPPESGVGSELAYLETRLLEAMDGLLGNDSSKALDGSALGSRLRMEGRTAIAAAWLRAIRDSGASQSSGSDSWNEVKIQLEDEGGAVRIRSRRDADKIIVQIQTTDPHLRGALSNSTERLEDQLRERYGADVDLSFSADSGPESGTNGSRDSRNARGRNAPLPSERGPQQSTPARRGADRVWVG